MAILVSLDASGNLLFPGATVISVHQGAGNSLYVTANDVLVLPDNSTALLAKIAAAKVDLGKAQADITAIGVDLG